MKPPRSPTTEGTAVARIVVSIATRPTLSITASRTGPRSLRSPTSARLTAGVALTYGGNRPAASVPRSADSVGRLYSFIFTVRGGDCTQEQASVAGAEIRNRDFFFTFSLTE